MHADEPAGRVADRGDREQHQHGEAGSRVRALHDAGHGRGHQGAHDESDEQTSEPEGLQGEAPAVAGEARDHHEHHQEEVEAFTRPYRPTGESRSRLGAGRAARLGDVVTIAHISDPHVGSPYFVPNLMNRVIVELNELEPDVVICSGDLTNEGYRQEYKNWVAYADRIQAPMYTVPGNHDARNVGYLHFEELVGPRDWSADVEGRPAGRRGLERARHQRGTGRTRPVPWIHEQFDVPADLKVFVLHHHLLPIPGTGRERSTVMDAGDLLEELIQAGVNIVLSGHKHVPYVWRLEDLYVANAGTVASAPAPRVHQALLQRPGVRGRRGEDHAPYPFGGGSVIAHFQLSTGEQYHRELEPPVLQRRLPAAHQGES